MKVLMVHKTLKGGVAVHVKEVSRELRKCGIEVDEVTRTEDLHLSGFGKSILQMRSRFRKWGREYDIVHTHDWSITFPALSAGLGNLVGTFHGFPVNLPARIFENYCISKLGRMAVVVSPLMKKEYANSTYIPNGVNLEVFKRKAQMQPEKNLVGVAQPYNLAGIIEIAEKAGFECVYTAGSWKYEDLGEFYSKLNVFVSIPYEQAGFNMVWLEALACEVPFVIGTDRGIGRELPISRITGIGGLQEMLARIKTGNLKPTGSKRAWIAKNGYLWSDCAQKLIAIYQDAARK